MKPSAFAYHAPTTIAEAMDLALTLDNAKLLAGGQTLMPMMNFRFVQPDHVIDLNTVRELQGIDLQKGRLQIGSMTRQRDIERSELVRRVAPLIPEAYELVSHPQIRNRGTLGGSLCHLDPASEQPCFLAAQGAELVLRSQRGERRVSMADWALGYLTPNLEDGEVLARIDIDLWPRGHGWSFTEYARRQGDYAIVGVAVLASCDAHRRITRLAVALCGIAAGPVRLSEVEAGALGREANEALIGEVAAAARAQDTVGDAHVSAEYRRHLAGVLSSRALRTAFERMQPSEDEGTS